ncbi:disulfide bond formation protein B [Pseudomonas sp. JQ170]|uniref:disulfide bond formation protein B n=1 Tax=unclassified Pseudomonas TaxID=196821 RepID=UPI002654A479|nr:MULTISPECIES: disulfide bond formation protein B [unclassified Pseudomonas]MDN7140648.1 disulfide bond formation protein B [Pseudomonas sp. JQ170]WRO75937.1 disulfide bond formation protein B [Pseudomonas sp. 170C]
MPSAFSRSMFLLAFVVSVLMLAAAFYLEWEVGLEPCPLCHSQRLFLGAFSLVSVCAVLHSPGYLGARIYAVLALLCATCGALLAARHVWLQGVSWPVAVDCPPAVDSMPLAHQFKLMLIGSPDCVRLNWSFLDLTIPEWSLLAFVLLAVLALTRLFGGRAALFHRPAKI